MSGARKLQTEIDRVMKKIDEGVDLFDEIWEKVYNAEQQNQKEKYEMDLKKEIKKLQRLRDQIKTWIGGSEVKDKDSLLEARRRIETKMEQFKICEKETKTKTYSKEGLMRAEKLDPAEEAKQKSTKWISEIIDVLGQLVEDREVEIERLSAGKGKKTNKNIIEEYNQYISNHKFHINKLEGIMRLVNNDILAVESVDEIREELEYYVEAHEEDEYIQAYDEEMFYEALGLEDLDVVNVDRVTHSSSSRGKRDSSSSQADDDDVTSNSRGSSKKEKSNSSSSKKSSSSGTVPLTIGRAVRNNRSNSMGETSSASNINNNININNININNNSSTTTTNNNNNNNNSSKDNSSSFHKLLPSVDGSSVSQKGSAANTPVKNRIPAAGPSLPTPGKAVHPSSASAGGTSMADLLKRESEQQQEKERQKAAQQAKQQQLLREQQARLQEQQRQQQQQQQQQRQELLRQQELQRQQQQEERLRQQEQQRQQQQAQFVQQQQQQQAAKQLQLQQQLAAQQRQKQSNVSVGNSHNNVNVNVNDAVALDINNNNNHNSGLPTFGGLGGLVGTDDRVGVGGVPSPSPATTAAAAVSSPRYDATASYLGALAESYRRRPSASDSERRRRYAPRNPYPLTPASFPQTPHAVFDGAAVFERLGPDCLFFVFYYAQGTYQQYLAARELKKQSWRYHKKYMTWFQRHEEPKVTTDEYEQGTYVYFDYETGWCQRIKADFRFEYSYLEDSLH